MSTDWRIFTGKTPPHDGIDRLLDADKQPPVWRQFGHDSTMPEDDSTRDAERGKRIQVPEPVVDIINAAIYLRRPVLVTGAPGTGKSSLAYAIAYELKLGAVLRWPITTRTTLEQGLYRYDAIARLQDVNERKDNQPLPVGKYIQLGPLGTALLPSKRPRMLLIDEIDKSDIDLPNDLLNIFEEGEFEIPELARRADEQADSRVRPWDSRDMNETVLIRNGRVRYTTFPIIIMTSNGERTFPPAFLRRCLQLTMPAPDEDQLKAIITAQLGDEALAQAEQLIAFFLQERGTAGERLATDQLLNAIYLLRFGNDPLAPDKDHLRKVILRSLTEE